MRSTRQSIICMEPKLASNACPLPPRPPRVLLLPCHWPWPWPQLLCVQLAMSDPNPGCLITSSPDYCVTCLACALPAMIIACFSDASGRQLNSIQYTVYLTYHMLSLPLPYHIISTGTQSSDSDIKHLK